MAPRSERELAGNEALALLSNRTFGVPTKLNVRTLGILLAQLVGWAWFLIAGVGGLVLLIHQGPWPITNGWFAMFSGISACPLTGWLLKKRGAAVSGYVQ